MTEIERLTAQLESLCVKAWEGDTAAREILVALAEALKKVQLAATIWGK